jgi:hypothetical protein
MRKDTRNSPIVLITALLGFAGGCALLGFLPLGQAQAELPVTPIPADPHGPVLGSIRVPATPAERAAAFSLLERALQNSDMHMPGSPPFNLELLFTAGGDGQYVGSGQLAEIWLSGQSWRWSASLGSFKQIQLGSRGTLYAEKSVPTPMRVHMLRNAIFWPVQYDSAAAVRTANVQWNGKPATSILVSRVTGSNAATQSRLWEEIEYCIDNATGQLQVYSIAPGSYAVYSYGRNVQFHGRLMPDQLTYYVHGAEVIDAQIRISDAEGVDPTSLGPTQQMIAAGPAVVLSGPQRIRMNAFDAAVTGAIKPVMVCAEINSDGKVLEVELLSAADPALAQRALDLIRNRQFPAAQNIQRQAYINVRFAPTSQP